MSALKLHVSDGLGRSDINAGVGAATGSNGGSARVTILTAKFIVNFPVNVEGVLEDASAVRTTILRALLGVDGVMSGASRSDDTSGLFSARHLDANLSIAVSRASGGLVVGANLNLLTLL